MSRWSGWQSLGLESLRALLRLLASEKSKAGQIKKGGAILQRSPRERVVESIALVVENMWGNREGRGVRSDGG